MNWIITCFNTPHYQMTALQELAVAAIILPVILLVVWIASNIILRAFK